MNDGYVDEIIHARSEGLQALQAVAEKHLPLVGAMLKRFPDHLISREDLYQQGCVGLMKALKGFDPARGTAFSTYAAAMIIGEMRMLRRTVTPLHIPRSDAALQRRIRQVSTQLTAKLQREPTIDEIAREVHMDASEMTLHMESFRVCSSDAETGDGASIAMILQDPDDWEKRLELQDIFCRLPPMDQKLLILRHRLGMTQTAAGERLGMTQMQVSRREKIIRTLLKRALTE